MKKLLLIGLSGVGLLVAAVIVIAFMLPSDFNVERNVSIDAAPEVVHEFVNDLHQWPVWQPWNDEDPSIKTTVGAVSSGVGASQSWSGDSGSGELTFTRSDPAEGVEYDLNIDNGAFQSIAGLRYKRVEDGTEVTWYMRGDVGNNPVGRYFAYFTDGFVGPMFERGLSKLKVAVESR